MERRPLDTEPIKHLILRWHGAARQARPQRYLDVTAGIISLREDP
jgi:hypothetical protein